MSSAIAQIVLGVLGFISGKLFPKKTQAQQDNARERTEADIARQTEQDSQDDQSKIDSDTDSAASDVESDSVRSGAQKVSKEVDRANSDMSKR